MKEIVLRSLTEIYDSLMERLNLEKGGPEMTMKTLPTLNQKILGFYRKRLYVIGGRTSQGKTTLAMQIAMDLAKQGKRVFFLTFEMDEEEMMIRMIANICNEDANCIRHDPDLFKGKLNKIKEFFGKRDKFPFLLTYNVGKETSELIAMIADLPKPDVVIVDYIQAIKKLDIDKLTTMNNYILSFRELAVTNNFVGILLSQINRGAMDSHDKKPQLWQLKGSGTIEEHSDVVLLCHWDYFYTNNPKKLNDYTICIAKNRQGPTGMMKCAFLPDSYLFKDTGDSVFVTAAEVASVKGDIPEEAGKIAKMFDGSYVDED